MIRILLVCLELKNNQIQQVETIKFYLHIKLGTLLFSSGHFSRVPPPTKDPGPLGIAALKDIVLVMGRQFRHKIILQGLGTKPQVEYDHAREIMEQGF